MSVHSKTVNVCGEVDSLLSFVVGVVKDVKAGKSASDVVADAVPALVAALTGLGDLKSELADRKDVEATVALKVAELVNVFVP